MWLEVTVVESGTTRVINNTKYCIFFRLLSGVSTVLHTIEERYT